MHPERAALISAMRQNNTNAATVSEPLPPDVDAARKTRINKELIEVFKRPCPENATPSIQGIGLYTHVAGPPAPPPQFPHEKYTQKVSNPVFLHIGGPAGIPKEGNVLAAPISIDVKKAWKDVQTAVDKEAEHVAQVDLDISSLKERYGALDNDASAQPISQPQPQPPQIMDYLQDKGEDRTLDVTMSGSEVELHASTSAAWTGNYYEAARDPRLRGR